MVERFLGNIPIMLRSRACHLHNLTPAQVTHFWAGTELHCPVTAGGAGGARAGVGRLLRGGRPREDTQDASDNQVSGQLIIRRNPVLVSRRNYPVAMCRGSWKNRGKNFSDKGVLLECGKRDLTTTKNVLHFVTTGNAKFMFSLNKELFFVPVIMILKCLKVWKVE